jgi:hypothetical protein
MMAGVGGYTWGETLPSSQHGVEVEGMCITCHMAETPGMDADGNPLPGHNTVGGHTFAMTSPDGVANLGACVACHESDNYESFEISAGGDYDGDGEVESTNAEVAGLVEAVGEALAANDVPPLDHYPYYGFPVDDPATLDVDVKGAVYNHKFGSSKGAAIHNFKYTVALLQLSYEKLMGEPVPNADIME